MKKGIIVLLIAVLVSGFAFAGKLTGDATIKFDTDLKAKTWGFANTQSWKYTFGFEYDTTKVEIKGETKAWAELSITGTAKLDAAPTGANTGTAGTNFTASWSKYTVSLSKADIVFQIGEKELRFGILDSGAASNFVTSYYAYTGSTKYNIVAGPSKILPGFNVKYDGYTGGFGAKGSWTDDDFFYNIFAHAESKTFAFAEKKVTLNAGIWTVLSNDTVSTILGADWKNEKILGGSVKAHYGLAADKKAGTPESTITANAAADLSYKFTTETEAELAFKWEASADVKYNIKEDASENVKLEVYTTMGKYLPVGAPAKAYYVNDYKDALKLDAKVTYSGHTFTFGETTLALSGSAEIQDSLVDKRELIVSAKEVLTLKVEKSLVFTFTETYKILVAKELAVVAEAKYTAKDDKFVATAKLSPTFNLDSEAKTLLKQLKFEAEIYTEKIVDKAKLGVKYSRADFIKDTTTEKIKDAGLISAYATISFK